MYSRDIPRLPSPLSRSSFIDKLFDLGLHYECSSDTLITATVIGDDFVSYPDPIPSYKFKNRTELSPDDRDILINPLPQEYSFDLACVALSIASAIHEDDKYSIYDASRLLDNSNVVYKLQWEICIMYKFCIPRLQLLTVLSSLNIYLAWDLTKDICSDKSLLYATPQTLILGLTLLKNKIKARSSYRFRWFTELFTELADEFEVDVEDILHAYTATL